MKHFRFLFLVLCLCESGFAQRTVLTYPFEMEKSFLQKANYDAYFLDNQTTNNFAFILKDNKKVDYVLVNDKFKVGSEFVKNLEETVFDHDTHLYLGGTTDKNVYHYVYKVTDKKFMSTSTTYMEETVDFDSKTIAAKKIFDIPGEEHLLVSFCDHNHYFTITANKKTSDLHFYQVLANGEAADKTIHFDVPAGMSKDKNELTKYLADLKVIREGEEPGLDVATSSTKLFCYADKLVFTINDGDKPTHLFSVDLTSFTGTSTFIDHSSLVEKENRGKSYVSSFLKDDRAFALILNKKDIKIAVYKESDGSLINKVVIDGDDGIDMLAEPPVTETRMGKARKDQDVDNLKKVIRAFTNGTEGLTVGTNKNGQFVLQVGTYDLIPMNGGGVPMGHYQGGFESNPGYQGQQNVEKYTWNPAHTYVPGSSGYMATSARYYKTTYFKLLLDPKTLKPVHGRAPALVGDQVKDYIDDSDKRAKAAKQFAMADRQYYGFYDRDGLTYVIEEISIRK
jgi:hypothetical protein